MLLVSGVLAIASASQAIRFARSGDEADKPHVSWSWAACSGSVCLALCFAAIAGLISALAGVILGTVAALITLGVMWEDAHRPLDPSKPEDGTRGLAKAAGDMAIAAVWAAASVLRRERAEEDEDPADELATRRGRKAETEALPIASPDALPPPPPPPPSTNGRTPPVTTPPLPEEMPPGSGGGGGIADIFTALQAAIMRNKARGMPGNHETVKMLAEAHDYLRQHCDSFARYMMEQGQYGAPIWEPIVQMAGHSRAAVSAASQSDMALTTLARMPVGDVAVNPAVRAPHHGELNASQ
jgi:hypothetical protein